MANNTMNEPQHGANLKRLATATALPVSSPAGNGGAASAMASVCSCGSNARQIRIQPAMRFEAGKELRARLRILLIAKG